MDGGPRLQDDTAGYTLNVLHGILWLRTLRTHQGRGYPGLECVYATLVLFVALGIKPGFRAREEAFH